MNRDKREFTQGANGAGGGGAQTSLCTGRINRWDTVFEWFST